MHFACQLRCAERQATAPSTLRFSVPLPAIHPAGLAGCDLLATPDALLLTTPVAGAAGHAIPIPNVPALAGVVLHQQFVQVEFGPQLSLLSLSSSNLVTLTVGIF